MHGGPTGLGAGQCREPSPLDSSTGRKSGLSSFDAGRFGPLEVRPPPDPFPKRQRHAIVPAWRRSGPCWTAWKNLNAGHAPPHETALGARS
jgi:hypothetical protein